VIVTKMVLWGKVLAVVGCSRVPDEGVPMTIPMGDTTVVGRRATAR
jgi:hypothetical protein